METTEQTVIKYVFITLIVLMCLVFFYNMFDKSDTKNKKIMELESEVNLLNQQINNTIINSKIECELELNKLKNKYEVNGFLLPENRVNIIGG